MTQSMRIFSLTMRTDSCRIPHPMRFPLILIKNGKDSYPELITAPWQLGQPGLDVLQKQQVWIGSNCYMDGTSSRITNVSSKRKGRFWESLLHRSDPAYWNVQVEMTVPKGYSLDNIKMELMQAVEQDDMNLTEFYSPECITYLINRCNSFAEILVVGCLTGMWEADNSTAHLPGLYQNDSMRDCVPCVTSPEYNGPLSEKNICSLAEKVIFSEHAGLFEEIPSAE